MSMQDPISDMLTRLRNAGMAEHDEVDIPHSKLKESIARVLKDEGYVADVSVSGESIDKALKIRLKYHEGAPVIEGIKRVSKPSCRIYCGAKNVPKVRNGLGTAILSTPKGVISNRRASKENVGGEVLCHVW